MNTDAVLYGSTISAVFVKLNSLRQTLTSLSKVKYEVTFYTFSIDKVIVFDFAWNQLIGKKNRYRRALQL